MEFNFFWKKLTFKQTNINLLEVRFSYPNAHIEHQTVQKLLIFLQNQLGWFSLRWIIEYQDFETVNETHNSYYFLFKIRAIQP
jgi:hypothetical protein